MAQKTQMFVYSRVIFPLQTFCDALILIWAWGNGCVNFLFASTVFLSLTTDWDKGKFLNNRRIFFQNEK